eukprot:13538196-Heterocapsa_arctica.AAC.1
MRELHVEPADINTNMQEVSWNEGALKYRKSPGMKETLAIQCRRSPVMKEVHPSLDLNSPLEQNYIIIISTQIQEVSWNERDMKR